MNDFNRRLIPIIRVTKEGALKTNIWEKKCKIEIASAAKAIHKIDQKKIQNAMESSDQEAARIVAAIMSPKKILGMANTKSLIMAKTEKSLKTAKVRSLRMAKKRSKQTP